MALRATLVYCSVSAVWIAVSDRAVATMVSDPRVIERISILKGWAFVALSGGLLYSLLHRQLARVKQEHQKNDEARQSLKLFRVLMDRSNENIEVYDAKDYRVLDVNEFACLTHGYTRAEYLQLTVFDLHPELTIEDGEQMKETLRRDGPVTVEALHRRKDGTTFVGEATLTLVSLDHEYVVAVRRDITEKKRTEEALRLFRNLMDRSGEMIEVVDPVTDRILDMNERACRVHGLSRKEYLKLTLFDLAPPFSREQYREYKERMRRGETLTVQGTVLHKDGSSFVAEARFSLAKLERDYVLIIVRDITERKRVEDEQRLFRSLMDRTGEVIEVIDPKSGRILDVNERACLTSGYSRDEYLGLTVFDFRTDLTKERFLENQEQMRANGPITFESPRRRKDGSAFPSEITLSLVNLDRDYLVAIIRDISERKRAEIAMRESEERFRQVVENITEVFWMYDVPKRAIGYVSPAYEKIWGATCASLYEKPESWTDPIVPSDRDRVIRAFAQAQVTGRYDETFQLVRPDGSLRWVRDRGFSVAGPGGELSGIVGVAEDITEQKQAEVALRENEERFRLLIANATDVIAVVDAAGMIQFQSPSTQRVLGYSPEQVMGHPVLDFIHPEDRPRAGQDFTRAFQGTPANAPIEYRARHADGSWRVFQSIGRAMADADGKTVVVVNARDITETRRLEDQYRQSQKMEAIGTLAGGIAHDFNNILTGIYGYTELARMEAEGMPAVCEKLDQVLKAGARAAELVKHILTFSRRQGSQRSLLQLHLAVEEPLKLLRATLPTTIEIRRSIDHQAPAVLADPTQIHQVLMNLCTNAWQAMRGRPGVLEVRLERFDATAAAIEHEPRLHVGCYARLSVSDTGCGMDAETLRRAFEPFFTTKGPGEGTGLGLSVVHGIMETHDGFISVQSQPGMGTTFELYFPGHEDAVPRVETKSAPIPRGRGERILVVDDEPPLAILYQAALEKLGYTVEMLTDSSAALERVRAGADRFDLIVTDQTMPGLTGVDLAREIRAFAPGLPVVLTTGYSGTANLQHFLDAGIKDLLSKPPTMESLGIVVHRVLLAAKAG